MLRAENIWKSYEGLDVLKGVSLEIEKSSITSIIGKSGAGKSTLLHILGTLDKSDKGSVFLDNIELNKLKKKELSRLRNEKIGFVFQFHHLINEFTALENISIPALINKRSKKETEKKALGLLEYLGLVDRKDHKPSQLSGGEQQRVAVARALINDPVIIFAHEPTGNLDTKSSQEMHQLFVEMQKDLNQTFVIVTHNEELAGMSDRCLEMSDGIILNDSRT